MAQSKLSTFGFKRVRLRLENEPQPFGSITVDPTTATPSMSTPSPKTSSTPPPATTSQAGLPTSEGPVPPPGRQHEGPLATGDLSQLDEPPAQPKLKKFPYTVSHGKARCFSLKWYDEFPWVEYSVFRDALFCKMCRHFPSARAERAFSRDGYTDWKHLRNSFEKHEKSEQHSTSLSKFEAYRETKTSGRGNVIDQMDLNAWDKAFVERNREHIKVVLDIIMLCAKQDLSLRGHREMEEDLNRGNFLEIFKWVCKYDPQIKARLEQLPKNATLMSPDIQNELLESAASLLLRKIRDEIKEVPGTYFAIMADEYKDVSKRELVAVCVRYIHGGKIKERAVGFVDTSKDMSAQGISAKILEIIEPLGLDPSLCVGFSFDGASVMSGHKGGVQVILKETFPHAVYVHCNSHPLNLVLSAVTKASGHVSTFFETVNIWHAFMTGSSRHTRFVEMQKEMHPGRPCLELERSVDTRWSSKAGSVDKILTLFDVILEVLAECAESSGQTKVDAQSLLQQIQTKKFLFLLVTFGKLFETSSFATRGLQSPTLSVTGCIDLIEGLKDSFAEFRDKPECVFQQVMKLTEDLMQKYEFTSWDITVGTRKRSLPSRLIDSVVWTTLGKATAVRNDDDLRHIWNDILDRQLTELDTRFNEDQYGIMKTAAAFLPQSQTFGEKESLRLVCNHYNISVGDAELMVFYKQLKRKALKENFPSLMEVLDICPTDIFPNLNRVLQVILTLPITSCSAERLFSTVGRIKNYLRSKMNTERLNHLSLLSFEREISESLDYDEIITIFNRKPRRLRLV